MQLVDIRSPDDPLVGRVADLLLEVFADPNSVLDEARMREFLADSAERIFTVLTILDADELIGATVYSYVPRSNCGFSEYLVVRGSARGRKLGRLLFDARKARLDSAAVAAGYSACNGLFIEADSPERTPRELLAQERETALDAHERLRIFAHLGFLRVDMPYVQPPLGPGKEAVDYLDLLFAPWCGALSEVPATWLVDTLGPIWRAWAGPSVAPPTLAGTAARLLPL